jgi:hypothetical protein
VADRSAPAVPAEPLADPVDEAERIVDAAERARVTLRVTGGVAVAMLCPSARQPPLQRHYQDIDFVARSRQAEDLGSLFLSLGYEPDEEFNVLHGQYRLFFLDRTHRRQADVFLDRIAMCHELDLRHRLEVWGRTLSPVDLLLTKLQVVETNEKDYKDAIALLLDHPLTRDDSGINLTELAKLCGSDWGWWRTVTLVAARTDKYARSLPGLNGHADVLDEIRQILAELETTPKSRRWKLRARIGERVRWHETPEDLEH